MPWRFWEPSKCGRMAYAQKELLYFYFFFLSFRCFCKKDTPRACRLRACNKQCNAECVIIENVVCVLQFLTQICGGFIFRSTYITVCCNWFPPPPTNNNTHCIHHTVAFIWNSWQAMLHFQTRRNCTWSYRSMRFKWRLSKQWKVLMLLFFISCYRVHYPQHIVGHRIYKKLPLIIHLLAHITTMKNEDASCNQQP